MHFDNLKDLQRSVLVHESFQNEIKGKRIKKELSNLEEYHHEAVRFIGFGLGEAGIALHVRAQ